MVRVWYWSRSDSKEEGEQPGCMRGMFHFFHFHRLLFTGGCRTPAASTTLPEPELHYNQKSPQQPYRASSCKGVEAPRNSLELQEFETAIPEDYYGVPISIQIAQPPAMSKKKESPAVTPRTRSIVARLMGLEVLEDEDYSSPRLTGEKLRSMSYFSDPALVNDGNVSYKKQKKIKKAKKKLESLHGCERDTSAPRRPLQNLNSNFSRSFSLPDSPRASSERPRDTEPRFSLQLDKENREENASPENHCIGIKRSNHGRDGRFGFDGDENTLPPRTAERKNVRKNGSTPKTVLSKPVKKVKRQYPSPTSLPAMNVFKPRVETLNMEPGKCSKARYNRFTERITRQSPQPTMFKEEASLQVGILPTREEHDPEFNYVKAILGRADVAIKRFSLSRPIDPTIFHILELRQQATASLGTLKHRWNRKLLFHLVEEILGDLLLYDFNGQELLSRVWSLIRSLPGPAVCHVVGDIDSLVARELPVAKFRRLLHHPLLMAEARQIATEIERDILNSLLGEAAESLCLLCSMEIEAGL